MKEIAVIGIGNPLRSDDGIGIVLLHQLVKQKNKFPKTIDFIDGGTGGINLLHVLVKYNTVLFIDAVEFQGTPGESRIFSFDEIKNHTTKEGYSTHIEDMRQILLLSEKLKELPKTLFVFGIQPKTVYPDVKLSKELEQSIDHLLKQLDNEIKKYASQKNKVHES